MTLADERPKEPGSVSEPADEQPALALLTLIEEQGATGRLRCSEVYELYRRADGLLEETKDAETLSRLRACARVVMRRLAGPQVGREGFSMYEAVHDFEARLIEQALEEAGGSVTKAARLLGLTHQTLGTILNTRHKSLADKRTPVRRRLRSIFRKPASEPRH
jgi:DNA-binding protein Fis